MGYVCRCFYEKNIYLEDFGLHVTFVGDETVFKMCYGEILSGHGCSEQEIEDVIILVKREVDRRKELHSKAAERSCFIWHHYNKIHPELFEVKELYLEPEFTRIVNYAKSEEATFDGLISFPTVEKHTASQVYIIPVFTQHFCERLIEELENFNMSSIPKGRPNTMNNHGILLDELGFKNFLDPFMAHFIQPLTKILFPSFGGCSLDSYKAFTVKYKISEDLNLGYHFDNAEVTLNVCLGKKFTGGNLYFGNMKQVPLKESECTEMIHKVGYGCLHLGQHMHGALPIHSGERHNMVLWMRSSQIRNNCCPMCNKKPDLVEVTGIGDGFTVSNVSVCSTS